MIDLNSALNAKRFYRFTGPPEHWLTALKYWTWGLEEHHRERWKNIQTGDVFFIHSTGAHASAFNNAASGIIGIGVVGFDFSVKDTPLWHYEIKNNVNRWPLLIPLTEMYLFSDVPDPAMWESPEPRNDTKTVKLVDQLLANRIPIGDIKGFPQMGSFSSVSMDVAQQILFQNRPLYLYSGHSRRGTEIEQKPSDLIEVHDASETLRHAASLRFLESINKRIITKPYSIVSRDNDILARAEASHHSILEELIRIFRKKGYATLSNEYVDLFAHDEKRSFLFEVKSTENRNFKTQARKGIVQLYEYDYFEINKFKREKNINFEDQYRILVPSRKPTDKKYIDFINSLDLGVATVADEALKPVGRDFGFSKI
jgi:preprotein translocase subunit Sss1